MGCYIYKLSDVGKWSGQKETKSIQVDDDGWEEALEKWLAGGKDYSFAYTKEILPSGRKPNTNEICY